ncbi:MAG: hypothetical protein QOG83_762 [Alphaproteobacteria bacterium]|jgi:hypothetical protein|nr:hypothetical protein [Alphaproteobacteria bacterium]MEA2938262.1 hypothetical protein [Alphaproteobacteria bacterium]MEA2988051.1 hypothetical protein [Alphaproteobacteria bacterium]
MPVTTFVVALAVLGVLALFARERNYLLTGTGLLVVTGGLATWFVASFWAFG